jgi:hypothetical protein
MAINYSELRVLRRNGAFNTANPATMPLNCVITVILGTIAPLMVAFLVFGYCHLLVILAKGAN